MPTLPPRHPRHHVTQIHRADHGSPLDATADAAGCQELDPNILHELHRQSTKVYSIFIKLLFIICIYLFNEQLLRTQPSICTFKGWAVRRFLAWVDSPSQWTFDSLPFWTARISVIIFWTYLTLPVPDPLIANVKTNKGDERWFLQGQVSHCSFSKLFRSENVNLP